MTFPRRWSGCAALVALPLLTSFVAPAGDSYASPRCTKAVFWGMPSRSMPHFIGVPTADSMPASMGDISVREWTGHFGPGRARAVHGQVIEVERVGTVGLDAPFDDPGWDRRVLVVPWDYDPSCSPVYFGRSVLWNPPGERSLFWVRLRTADHWTDGVPTFDALSPRADVYPHPGPSRDARPGRLTVDELFALLEAMPDSTDLESEPARAVLRFRDAVRAAGVTDRYPAPALESNVSSRAAYNYVRSLRPSIGGTYRIEVRLPSGTVHTTYLRTASRPSYAWRPRDVPGMLRRPALPGGYQFWMVYGPTPVLPEVLADEPGVGGRSVWPLRVVDTPPEAAEVLFDLEVPELTRMFPESVEIAELTELWSSNYGEASRAGRIRDAPGHIVLAGDAARLELEIDVDWDGEPDIEIAGERLSRTVADPGRHE
jgi:hypothetical protein